jgi:folylpolyglutamate synthase/dihydropteroate synthase
MLDDKNPVAFLEPLLALDARWIVTELHTPRKMSADVLARSLEDLGQTAERAPSMAHAIELATQGGDDSGVVVVTGSLMAVAEARVHLGVCVPDPSPA